MRDYDPTTGRYIQADPLGLVDGASVYGYALQNPGRYTDPRGEKVVLICRPLSILGGEPGSARQHCAVFVVEDENECSCREEGDPDGIIAQFSLAGGAVNFDISDTRSDTYHTDRREYNSTFNPTPRKPRQRGPRAGHRNQWHIISPPSGMSSCDFDSEAIKQGRSFRDQESYNAIMGPNSNTAADNLIERSGGVAPNTGAQAQNYGEIGPSPRQHY